MDTISKPFIPSCLTDMPSHYSPIANWHPHPQAKITDKIPSLHAVYDAETVLLQAWRADLDNPLMPRDRHSRWTTEAWNTWLSAMMTDRIEESEATR